MSTGGSAFYEGEPFLSRELTLPLEDEEFAFPLSPSQERMWDADRASSGNPAYNGSFRWELDGPVELRTLERSFNEIIRRHEILRATFRDVDGSPLQIIAPSVRLKVAFRDLRALPPSQRQDEMDRLSSEEARRSFDLETGPLVRVGLLQMDDKQFILMFTVHHIVSDGWSISLVMEELQKIYAAFAQGLESPLPELRLQYPDYVIWQREAMQQPDVLRQLDYWKKKLAGYERLEVATDFERPLERTISSAIVSRMLPRELSDALKRFSDLHEGTMFTSGLAACMVLLARYTGKDDIAVGSPLAGRNRAELESLVGMFVNHVVLRASAAGDPSFPEFVARVRESVWEAFANQDVPFENVLKSMADDGPQLPSPFYAVNFICQREYARASTFVFDFAGIRMRTMPSKSQGALYDLNFFMVEREVGWRLSLEYNVDLYGEETALRMLQDFHGLLDAIASNPNRKLSELPLPAADARRGNGAPPSSEPAMNEPVEVPSSRAAAHDDVYALPASVVQKRFWVLNNLFSGNSAFQLPACVRLAGPLSEKLLEQSFQRVVARHEILRTTFEEIDGELAQIVAPSSAFSLAFTNLENLPEQQREPRVQQLIREETAQPFDLARSAPFRARLFRIKPEEHVLAITAHHILSDGWSHGILQNELWNIYESLAENREPQLAPLPIQFGDFVAWQKEWLASDDARAHLDFWTQRLAPPLPVLELPADGQADKRLAPHGAIETLLLPADLAAALKAETQTESATMYALLLTCFVALLARSTGREDIVIGSPVANRRAETEPLIGPFAGPIALRFDLSGNPALREVLHRVRDITLEALAHSDLPFESIIEKLTPRSVHGHNPLFQFYFFYQSAFLKPRHLSQITVTPLPTFSVGTSFEIQVGVIEREEGIRIQLEYNPDLFSHARIQRFLSDYHAVLRLLTHEPASRISDLPVVAPAATEPAPGPSNQSEFAPPRDETEKQLAGIWEDTLGVQPVGIHQNYFDLGGNSVLGVRLFARIEEVFHVRLPLATLFQAQTVEQLASVLRGGRSADWDSLVPVQPKGSRPRFFCVHGAGGNVLIYRALSRRLGEDQPFFGLQCQGLDGEQPLLHSVEEMASRYVKEIRRLQPHGPYFLGGYCLGGTIALEIAQQLTSQGEKVALVAMLGTVNWSKVNTRWRWHKPLYQVERLIFHFRNFLLLHSRDKLRFFREKMTILRDRTSVWRGILLQKILRQHTNPHSASAVLANIWAVNDRAAVEYVPRPYPGAITDFRPVKQYSAYVGPDKNWDNIALEGQEVVVLPVYPAGMLVEPFVQQLADALKAAIDRAASRV